MGMESVRAKIQKGNQGRKTDCQWVRWRIRCQKGPEGESGAGVGGGGVAERGEECVQRQIRGSEKGKKEWGRGAISPPHTLKKGGYGIQPEVG